MRLGIWDIFFNLALFVLWFHIWKKPVRTAFFNPYVGAIDRAGNGCVDFIRSALRGLPGKSIALLTLVFAIVFRAVVFRNLSGSNLGAWDLTFGIRRPDMLRTTLFHVFRPHSFGAFLSYSVVSFGVFLFYIWGLSLIYAHSKRGTAMGHPEEALYEFSKPLTFFKPEIRPFVLLAFGMGLTAWLVGAGHHVSLGTLDVAFLKLILSAMLAWVNGLMIMLSLVMALIIGSWIAMFSSSFGLAGFCRDWLDLFLGPMRRFPVRIGMLDLSPIVFFLVVHFVAGTLDSILQWIYTTLP